MAWEVNGIEVVHVKQRELGCGTHSEVLDDVHDVLCCPETGDG
jgi:hypothetical protein